MRGHGGRLRLLLLTGSLLGSGLAAQAVPQSSAMAAGKKLFDQNCAACHQTDGSGIVGSGFSAEQTADVATYVRNAWGNSFGPVSQQQVRQILGPSASGQPSPSPTSGATTSVSATPTAGQVLPSFDSLGAVQKGGRFFRLNCAPCHGATARGGALVSTGKNAPDLMKVPQAAIPAFIRAGPGPMPSFPTAVFSDSDASAIAAYVNVLQSAQHPGGFPIGFLGPVTEGFIAVVCGLGAAVLVAIWIAWKGRG